MHSVHVEVIGALVRIDTDVPELAAALREVWAFAATTPSGREPDVVIDAGREWAQSGGSLAAVMELLTQRVTLESIARRAGQVLMLHACALADPTTGAAVVMVGPSGMGKTTVARTLGRSWGYVTDETVAVESDLSLLPYPKPLSILVADHEHKEQVAPQVLGLRRLGGPIHARAVLLLERLPHAGDVRVEEIPTVPAIARLAEHASFLGRMDRPLSVIADLLHRTGGLRRVTYGEAAELQPLVTDLLRPPLVGAR